jgi:pimeloyl-ACP methyl ester carboxylesterase
MFDHGSGPALVIVQGLHGRWEWTKPVLTELSKQCRTIAYSLCGDFGSGVKVDPELGFDNYVRQLDGILDRAGLERAAVCGISFGGFVAVRYAAKRPERVNALILASAPGPGWEPTAQQSRWLARPWVSAPAFVLSAPFRLWPEISAALPRLGSRLAFMARHGLRAARAPIIPSLMAERIRQARAIDFGPDYAHVRAPTLVLTGEDGLDRVVPVEVTRRYASRIAGAKHVVMDRTGHIGVLTQPERFARIVAEFVHAHSH